MNLCQFRLYWIQLNQHDKNNIKLLKSIEIEPNWFCLRKKVQINGIRHFNVCYLSFVLDNVFINMRGSRKFCQRVPNLITFFCFVLFLGFFFSSFGERGSKYRFMCGPSSAFQRNTIEMAIRWRTDDGPTLNAVLVVLWFLRGSGPVLLKNPICLWFFRGVRTPCRQSGSAHV